MSNATIHRSTDIPGAAGDEVYRYFCLQKRALISVRNNGTVFCKDLRGDWRLRWTRKDAISLEEWLNKKQDAYNRTQPWQRRVRSLPSMAQLAQWSNDCVCETPTGESVEPDGEGSDGAPSWLVCLGLI